MMPSKGVDRLRGLPRIDTYLVARVTYKQRTKVNPPKTINALPHPLSAVSPEVGSLIDVYLLVSDWGQSELPIREKRSV
jgi:hypothetical protein